MKDKFVLVNEDDYKLPNPKGLGVEFYESFLRHHDKVAQICCETGRKDSFGDVLIKAKRLAISLKHLKIQRNDVICLCTNNHMSDIIVWVASQFLCCIISTIDANTSLNDVKSLVKQVTPKIVFTISEAAHKMEEALKCNEIDAQIVVFDGSEKHSSFESFLQPSAEEADFVPETCENVKDTAVIVFSSGSTGLPKGICLNHFGLLCQTDLRTLTLKIGPRWLKFSTLYWISSIIALIANIRSGYSSFIATNFSVDKLWQIVKEFNVEGCFLPPHMLLDVVDSGVPKDLDTTSLSMVLTGGSTITGQQILDVRKHFPGVTVYQALGQTEVSGLTFAHSTETEQGMKHMTEKPGSVGCLRSGMKVKIVDPETGASLGPNQTGELRVKSDFLMSGYHNMDSSDCFDENGWFKTGDLMYYDDDEYFYHVDRIKEMFKFRQIHIQPVLLEEILLSHPAVLKAVVIGVPDLHDGHHPMGVVVLKNDVQHITEDEIIKFVDAQVDDPKKLRAGLKIVTDIPLTVTGKVMRRVVRKMVLGF